MELHAASLNFNYLSFTKMNFFFLWLWILKSSQAVTFFQHLQTDETLLYASQEVVVWLEIKIVSGNPISNNINIFPFCFKSKKKKIIYLKYPVKNQNFLFGFWRYQNHPVAFFFFHLRYSSSQTLKYLAVRLFSKT